MKKGKGTKSKAQVKLSKKGPVVTVDDLSYELESINMRARGTIVDSKKINADIALNAFLPEAVNVVLGARLLDGVKVAISLRAS